MDAEKNVWAMLGIFALIIGFAYFAITEMHITETENELRGSAGEAEGLRKALNERKAELAKLESSARQVQERNLALEAARKLQDELETLRNKETEAENEIRQIQEATRNIQKQWLASVQTGVKMLVGKQFASIQLPSLRVLKNAKLIEATPQSASFHHDAGITKINVNEMPDDVRKELGFPDPAILKKIGAELEEYEKTVKKYPPTLLIIPGETPPDPFADFSFSPMPQSAPSSQSTSSSNNSTVLVSLERELAALQGQYDRLMSEAASIRAGPKGTISASGAVASRKELEASRVQRQIQDVQERIARTAAQQ